MLAKQHADAILASLDQAAEASDPSPQVYERIFAQHPEMEQLFWRDRDGSIRGHMFQEMVTALIDYLGPNTYGANLFKIEHTNHEQLGVPAEVYPAAFAALRDVVRDTLKADWTRNMEQAWTELLTALSELLQPTLKPR